MPARKFANQKALLDYAEQNHLVYVWEGGQRQLSPLPAFTKRQQLLSPDQYEIVEVAKARLQAMAPPRLGKEADATVSTAKPIERVDTVAATTNGRGWGIFAGFVISYLLLASVVVLFATYWA